MITLAETVIPVNSICQTNCTHPSELSESDNINNLITLPVVIIIGDYRTCKVVDYE